MNEVLIGSLVTVAILAVLRLVERRMGRVFIRGTLEPEEKLAELEEKIKHLTQKITVLETQADYLIETIIECRKALEKEQSVKQYLSERVSVLQGYRNWNATQPNTTDSDPLPPGLEAKGE
jgi:L-rhamnose isomerase